MEKNTQTTQTSLTRHSTYLLTVLAVSVAVVLLAAVVLFCTRSAWLSPSDGQEGDVPAGGVADREGSYPYADGANLNGEDQIALLPFADDSAVIHKTHTLYSASAALVDVSAGQVIASSRADTRIYPASMTKVMTLIVIAEHLPETSSMKDYITIRKAVVEEMAREEANLFGFEAGQQFTVESLIYALMLKSDGVAAVELATYIAGSQEAFVELMNQKAKDMGLADTHFTNPIGLQDEDNYSTCRDIASIMNYAMKMSLCREVMSTVAYRFEDAIDNNAAYKGYFFHSLLRDRLENQPANQPASLTVTAGKTGYAGEESGSCLVTYAVDKNGKAYICVTAKADGMAGCIEDYKTIYNNYAE